VTKTCVTAAGLYCGIGMAVPIAPTIAGIGAVILVRTILWAKKQSIRWNLAVMALAMMATFVTVEGSQMSTFFGFWLGIGYGGMGQGIINLGRSSALSVFKQRFGEAAKVFMGTAGTAATSPPEPAEPEPEYPEDRPVE